MGRGSREGHRGKKEDIWLSSRNAQTKVRRKIVQNKNESWEEKCTYTAKYLLGEVIDQKKL